MRECVVCGLDDPACLVPIPCTDLWRCADESACYADLVRARVEEKSQT